jgi:NhaP-type Na+/H+ or K+/H+ antiporter
MESIRRSLSSLKPAVLCLSMVMLMLGITFVLVAALAIWFRSPEQLYLYHLSDDKTFIRGGETLLAVFGNMRGEVTIALALLAGGFMGIHLGRPDQLSSSN